MKDYLKNLLKNNKALFLAYDHGFEHGPDDFNEINYDPTYILNLAIEGGFTGIVLQKGIAEKYYTGTLYEKKIPLILKLNGKTNLGLKEDPYSAVNCSVEYAKELGAKAVGYTIYLGSSYEPKMFEEFGKIQEKAHKLNLAVILWAYPKYGLEDNPKITEYAGRISLELGADLAKIKYSDSQSFKKAIKLANKTKIVLSGGPLKDEKEFLKTLKEVISFGAIGVTVGRNVWQRGEPLRFIEKIKKIIFG